MISFNSELDQADSRTAAAQDSIAVRKCWISAVEWLVVRSSKHSCVKSVSVSLAKLVTSDHEQAQETLLAPIEDDLARFRDAACLEAAGRIQ